MENEGTRGRESKPGGSRSTGLRWTQVKLIFNPGAGKNKASPAQLISAVNELQKWKLVPELFLIEPGCDLPSAVRDAVSRGIRLFAVCGGDGTVSSAVKALAGQKATLGILPSGTHNNVALSLGIPTDLPQAAALLRQGRRIKMDLGITRCEGSETPFVELCSVGMLPELFAAGDDIQHGNLTRIGDFLSTLLTTQLSRIRLLLEDHHEIQLSGHVVLVCNTPYVISNNKVGSPDAYRDGLLDVILCADQSKLNLITHVLREAAVSELDDPSILHYRVRKVEIETHPAMPVMADSVSVGEGRVVAEVNKAALTVIAGPEEERGKGESRHE